MATEHNPTSAVDRLAYRLHWTMERFDPSDVEENWDSLTEVQREFYRAVVREVLLEREHVLAALGQAHRQ